MTKYIVLFIILWTCDAHAQSVDTSGLFKIMTWNGRWMGDVSNCGCDTAASLISELTVLQVEQPDIVAFQEVVNMDYWKRLVAKSGYLGIISPYASLAPDSTSGNYPLQQKMAFLYKPSRIKLINTLGLAKSTYPFLVNTNSPYYFFSSGRFPFMAQFELQAGNRRDSLWLVNLHGKANADNASYMRRLKSTTILEDSLNTYFGHQKKIILGDYNDLLKGSIVNGQVSPYADLFTHGFVGFTFPDSFPGQETYYPISGSLIDNIVTDTITDNFIVPSSVKILQNVQQYIFNYANTSDHYPVIFNYQMKKDNPNAIHNSQKEDHKIYPNPSSGILEVNASIWDELALYTVDGKQIWNHSIIQSEVTIPEWIDDGTYLLVLKNKHQKKSIKFQLIR